jgi:hypothetical protein
MCKAGRTSSIYREILFSLIGDFLQHNPGYLWICHYYIKRFSPPNVEGGRMPRTDTPANAVTTPKDLHPLVYLRQRARMSREDLALTVAFWMPRPDRMKRPPNLVSRIAAIETGRTCPMKYQDLWHAIRVLLGNLHRDPDAYEHACMAWWWGRLSPEAQAKEVAKVEKAKAPPPPPPEPPKADVIKLTKSRIKEKQARKRRDLKKDERLSSLLRELGLEEKKDDD